jgi:hypothetical protein
MHPEKWEESSEKIMVSGVDLRNTECESRYDGRAVSLSCIPAASGTRYHILVSFAFTVFVVVRRSLWWDGTYICYRQKYTSRPIQYLLGRAMAQAVSRRSLTVEARVRARVNPCGICGGQSGTGTGFLRVLWFSLSISFHRLSPNSYHLGDEQYVR